MFVYKTYTIFSLLWTANGPVGKPRNRSLQRDRELTSVLVGPQVGRTTRCCERARSALTVLDSR